MITAPQTPSMADIPREGAGGSQRVVFLDFDGVIRIGRYEKEGYKSHFCRDTMLALANIISLCRAKVVVTSDWRMSTNKGEITKWLPSCLSNRLHSDWATPVCGHRWNEVDRWLSWHPEVDSYVILEDFAPHFDGCPDAMMSRLVLCDSKIGVASPQLRRLGKLLTYNSLNCAEII